MQIYQYLDPITTISESVMGIFLWPKECFDDLKATPAATVFKQTALRDNFCVAII